MSFYIGQVLENPDVSQMSREYIYGNRDDQRFLPCTVAEGNGTPNGYFGRVRGGTVMTRLLSPDLDSDDDYMVRPYGETIAMGAGVDSDELEVRNSECFFPGDKLVLSGTSEVTVLSKDGNVLTLDDEYTWGDGDHVITAREDGVGGLVPCAACGILYMDIDTWLRRDYSGNHVHHSIPAKLHVAGSVIRSRVIGLGPLAELELRGGSGTNILFHVVNSLPFGGGR